MGGGKQTNHGPYEIYAPMFVVHALFWIQEPFLKKKNEFASGNSYVAVFDLLFPLIFIGLNKTDTH